jgi:hypothetical protein
MPGVALQSTGTVSYSQKATAIKKIDMGRQVHTSGGISSLKFYSFFTTSQN